MNYLSKVNDNRKQKHSRMSQMDIRVRDDNEYDMELRGGAVRTVLPPAGPRPVVRFKGRAIR